MYFMAVKLIKYTMSREKRVGKQKNFENIVMPTVGQAIIQRKRNPWKMGNVRWTERRMIVPITV